MTADIKGSWKHACFANVRIVYQVFYSSRYHGRDGKNRECSAKILQNVLDPAMSASCHIVQSIRLHYVKDTKRFRTGLENGVTYSSDWSTLIRL